MLRPGRSWTLTGGPARVRRPIGFVAPSAAALGLVLAALACAKIEPPPGGPPDAAPPQLIAVTPDSLAVIPGFDGEVVFRFDEVISEGGTPSTGLGTGDLERIVVLSPSSRVAEVEWRRTRLAVRPREGWRPNTVYRVELLPGVTDLRSNRSTEGAVVTFTTGGAPPTDTLSGAVFDWTTGQSAGGALVEAVPAGDSIGYRTAADSGGRFRLGPIPRGAYVVYGALDQNRNGRREPRESYDSARVAAGALAVAELWTFPHDTVGPRVQQVTRLDSVSATIQLSQPLDPAQRLDSTRVRVRLLPDSTPVRVLALMLQSAADTLARPRGPDTAARPRDTARARAPRDTLRPPRDTLRPPQDTVRPRQDTARASRRPLENQLVVRVAQPWRGGGRYVVQLLGVRNVSGAAADASAVLAIPEQRRDTTPARAPARAPAGAPADTARSVPRDTARTPRDTTRPPR